MCPDREMISLYFDEELPSPWKEKMEAHLKSCNKCRTAFVNYKNIENLMQEGPSSSTSLEAAQERVWEKLMARGLPENLPSIQSIQSMQSMQLNQSQIEQPQIKQPMWQTKAIKRAWNTRITLPLPAAAAAVLIFVVFFAFLGVRFMNRPSLQEPVAAVMPDYLQWAGDDQEIILPMQDMTGVLQYLSSQDYGDFMVIRLPESRTFSRIGEPALINAADYSRRNTSR